MLRLTKIIPLILLLIISAGIAAAQSADSPAASETVLQFDIAEIPSRYSFDENKVDDSGMPTYGASFITQGYIYPEGTLDGTNGVLENGEPEFPELVLGIWTCKGWVVIEDMTQAEGQPAAATTQIFQFGDLADNNIVITEGYEMMAIDTPVMRAITGGSGDYFAVRGQQRQTLIGVTEQMGVNLRVALELAGGSIEIAAMG